MVLQLGRKLILKHPIINSPLFLDLIASGLSHDLILGCFHFTRGLNYLQQLGKDLSILSYIHYDRCQGMATKCRI